MAVDFVTDRAGLVRWLALGLALHVCALPTAAQQDSVPWNAEVPLYSQEVPAGSHQYDFMIGDWDIIAKRYQPLSGAVISELKVHQHTRFLNDGRMIFSEWTGYSPTTGDKEVHGVTLLTYSEVSDSWQNVFVGSHQAIVPSGFTTEKVGDEIHGGGPTFKIRFFDITEDSFEWELTIPLGNKGNWFVQKTQSATRRRTEED